MKGIIVTALCVAAIWFFWMTAVWVIRTSKKYKQKKKDKE